jgi:cytochrome c biogenesis protein CcmG, thiol:disulfide interchange protein DsbE
MLTRLTIVSIFLAACLTAAAVTPAQTQPTRKSASADLPLIDAQGYTQIVEKHRGQPLIITFWATWCEPCRDEYPMLNELVKQYAPQGLKVIGVNLDDDGDLILMRRFMARYKPVFPNVRKKKGGEADFTQSVFPGWNGAIPATFFYARDGRQIGHLIGENSRDTYDAAIRMTLSSDGAAGASK